MKNLKIIYIILAVIIFSVSCTYKSEEQLLEGKICDTLNLTYSKDIKPIFENNCYVCHGRDIQSGGFNIEDIQEINIRMDNMVLINAINRVPDFPQMPKNRDKLSDCLIKKIIVWNREGRNL
jgi:hypothetical protein